MATMNLTKTVIRSGEKFKATGLADNIFHLGMLLSEQRSLPVALRELAAFSGNRRVKAAAASAAERLAAGQNCEEVFASGEMGAFGGFARYILAAPMADKTKGRILSSWKRRSGSFVEVSGQLVYCFQSLAIGLLSCISLIFFVLPQFSEIMRGLKLKVAPGVMSLHLWLLEFVSGDSLGVVFVLGLLVVGAMGIAILLARRFFKVREIIDEVNLFNLLRVVEPAERCGVIELMAVSSNFPKLHKKLRIFAASLRQGEDLPGACQKAGLGSLTSWFLQMAMINDADETTLAQGAALLETTYEMSMIRTTRVAEIVSVGGQGLVFGLFAYVVFQSMITIMLGAMS